MNTSIFQRLVQSLVVCGIASIFVGGISAAKGADDFVKGATTKVRYADLDLSKPAGTAELYRRIKKASQTVCGTTFGMRHLPTVRDIEDCQRVAIANAVRDVGNARLTALHNVKGKQRVG